jgi:hypothetical protein
MNKKIKTYRMSIYLKDNKVLEVDNLLAYGISHNKYIDFHTLVDCWNLDKGEWNGMVNSTYELRFAYKVEVCDENGENNEVVWTEELGKIK